MNLNKFGLLFISAIMILASAFKFNTKAMFKKTLNININMSTNIKEMVTKSIKDNSVMIFSKTYCPHCSQCKSTLEKLNIKYGVLELDKITEGPEIQAELLAMTGQRTVPSVFVKGKHIGGNDNTQAAIKSGAFQTALNA